MAEIRLFQVPGTNSCSPKWPVFDADVAADRAPNSHTDRTPNDIAAIRRANTTDTTTKGARQLHVGIWHMLRYKTVVCCTLHRARVHLYARMHASACMHTLSHARTHTEDTTRCHRQTSPHQRLKTVRANMRQNSRTTACVARVTGPSASLCRSSPRMVARPARLTCARRVRRRRQSTVSGRRGGSGTCRAAAATAGHAQESGPPVRLQMSADRPVVAGRWRRRSGLCRRG